MNRVAIYLRISDEDKKIDKTMDSESIKNQRILLLDEVSKHKDWVLTDIYTDEDISGISQNRPEFTRMIKDCEKGLIDIVLCKSQSRFSRDMEVIEGYLHNKFLLWGVRFIGISDNADTENYGNKKARQINGLVNEWYLEDLSNNIKSAFIAKMKNGEFISPFAPFGYVIDETNNNKLLIDEISSKVVKKIYSLYLEGYGYTGIVNYLNKRKIPTPSKYKKMNGSNINIVSNKEIDQIKWNINTVKNILTNEIYTGNMVQGRRKTINYKSNKVIKNNKDEWITYENTHEKIISKKTFELVQNLIKENKRTIKNKRTKNILNNIKCLNCNNILIKKSGSKYAYLKCLNCHKSIRYDYLYNTILELINNNINEYYEEKTYKKENKSINNDIYIKNLYMDKVNNKIDEDTFNKLIQLFNKDQKELNKIAYLNNEKKYPLHDIDQLVYLSLINSIYIDFYNKEIIINWNF